MAAIPASEISSTLLAAADTANAPRMYEQALTLAAMGFHEEATGALRQVTTRAPGHAPAWKELAELLRLAGKDKEADAAISRAASGSAAWPPASDQRPLAEIDASEQALRERMRKIAVPEAQVEALREQLRDHENDVAALRLLGIGSWRDGDLTGARALFERALDLAPGYVGARADLAKLLHELGEDVNAVVDARRVVAEAPGNITYRTLYADILCGLGDFDSAIPLIEELIRDDPRRAHFRCVYAQVLRYAGRWEDSAQALRGTLTLQPGMGQAYWNLAELGGDYLTDDDVATIRMHLSDSTQPQSSRMLLQYALGRGLERRGDFAASFAAYEVGAALSREIAAALGEWYDPDRDAEQLRRRRVVFTAPLLARAAPEKEPDCTPIFVLGMPRAGSTLVEQILASHTQVEGTRELPLLEMVVQDLARSRLLATPDAYPECVNDLTASVLANLGKQYLKQAALYRKTTLPYFVDKRPWNWVDAGLIRLILPHAKIVDVRREPMAACFGMYKQMLPSYAAFSTDFNDLAHYFTQYVRMMAHYQKVMPGQIHFLSYERLIDETETEVRRLLEYCGLPFEDRCLRFWETDRVIATPSAEQVRRPIFRDALQHWRNYEPWLGPLRTALRAAGEDAEAAAQPAGFDLALMLAAMGMYEGALEELRGVVAHCPSHPAAWQRLAELLPLFGDDEGAARAKSAAARVTAQSSKWRATRDPRTPAQLGHAERKLHEQCSALALADQMDMLREHLQENPADAAAACVLAQLERRSGDLATTQSLLDRALELSPFFDSARAELVSVLLETRYFDRALREVKTLRGRFPRKPEYLAMHSDALSALGDFIGALTMTTELVREYPHNAYYWYGHGKVLGCVGRAEESLRALRTSLELSPTTGLAWWALADMKNGCLTDDDVTALRAGLADQSLEPSNRMYMCYALGHALEEAGDFSGSFAAYQQGARLFRGFFLTRGEAFTEAALVEHLQRIKRVFSSDFITRRAVQQGSSGSPVPIFIVGLPRAGSTLVEQILSGHSQVEATRELPAMNEIVNELARSRMLVTPSAYPDCVRDLDAARLAKLAELYQSKSRPFRRTDLPYFIDKQPWNWMEIGLIRLILPKAKIIDIRREPMAACFANFKQVLTDGADFSYDLHDLGRYYVEYAALMEHWKTTFPGAIFFLQYERLVEDTENEIRRLLGYCGLPFEDGCVRFWKNERAVSTPSAGQVRRPIYRQALEQWRNFEPWLGPLKAALAMPASA